MEIVSKLLFLTLAMMVMILASDVEGAGRKLKEAEKVDHTQNFIGGIGGTGTFPSPSFTGVVFGPSIFCTYPGGCTTPTPTLPFIPSAGGSPPHA
ncbi:hypothetical protein TanjilG_17037 [Lupinus angustifolius]|nr:hypothetical protein TanjilG_17037 [Lupinus angustifolius]